MTKIKVNYIPAPRFRDKEYSELCMNFFHLCDENRNLRYKLSSWRSYFVVAAALLLVSLVYICMQHIEIIFK